MEKGTLRMGNDEIIPAGIVDRVNDLDRVDHKGRRGQGVGC